MFIAKHYQPAGTTLNYTEMPIVFIYFIHILQREIKEVPVMSFLFLNKQT